MAELSDLEPSSKRFIERYPFPDLPAPHLAPLQKPLSESKVALVTTAGLHLNTDKPFSKLFLVSDCSYREIPSDVDPRNLQITHTSEEFDQSGAIQDLNVVLPIDRMKDLLKKGKIGAINHRHFSFMGSLPRTGALRNKTAPALARSLKEDGVDIVFLTPV